MPAPTDIEIRSVLEGYGIDSTSIITKTWIDARRDNFVIPWIERKTRCKFSAVTTVTEYYSGNGTDTLILNRRNVVAVTAIAYVSGFQDLTVNPDSIELLSREGILKARANFAESSVLPRTFPRGVNNIKLTYTYGYADYPTDIKEAICYLVAEMALGQIANRTGGGDISTQGFSRNFGQRGKYTHERDDLRRQAMAILRNYMTGITGA